MVHRPRREVKPVQTGLHLLQQPLRRFRARISERVPTARWTGRTRLERVVEGIRTFTEQHGRIPEVVQTSRFTNACMLGDAGQPYTSTETSPRKSCEDCSPR